jgi:polyketide synthase PksN
MPLAGGVNLSLHPQKYLNLSQGKFAASDGKCRSFGEGGDGYVPGEGVGAVLLKPLEDALRNGDHIYAVIKSSTVNHGGKTNGYTVPNPNAQGDLILDALKNGNINPRTLSYIETHGTGTSLGDPIEITGLKQAFAAFTDEKRICPIGAVKSNIGHLESAAGIAAVTKALPHHMNSCSVAAAELPESNIDFDDSLFYVQTSLPEWKRARSQPRRVAVSLFAPARTPTHPEEHVDAAQRNRAHRRRCPKPPGFGTRQDALYRYAARVATFLEYARTNRWPTWRTRHKA